MAIYKIQTPDGKILTLEGDTPPTEQDIDNILSQATQVEKPVGIMGGVRALAGVPREFDPTTKVQEYEQLGAKETGARLLRAGQVAGQFALPVASAPVTAATEYGIQRLRGAEPKQAGQEALVAGGLDLLLTGAGAAISKAAKPLLQKVIPFATGISKESTELALKKPGIFKGKLDLEATFKDTAKKAQDAVKYIQRKAGKAVGAEKEALRSIKTKFNFDDVANKVDGLLAQTRSKSGLIETLDAVDTKRIQGISDTIRKVSKKGASPDDLLTMREKIDNMISWKTGALQKPSGKAESILKQVRGDINKRLSEISPKFKRVNKKFSEIADLNFEVTKKIKSDPTAASNVKNIFKKGLATEEPVAFLDEFKALDKLAPKKYKFFNKANEDLVRSQFEKWRPKNNLPGATSLMGATGLGGLGYAAAGAPGVVAATIGLASATSPKAYKGIIKGGSALKRAMSTPAVRGTLKQALTRTATKPTAKVVEDLLLGGNR